MAENDAIVSAPKLRIGAIIQARVNSTRLPGKALLPLPLGENTTILEQIIRRARRAKEVSSVILAIPDSAVDDQLFRLAETINIPVLRGSEIDVLKRFVVVAQRFELDIVVRLTADNPAIDPFYIDTAVRAHLDQHADYTLTTGLPLGTNIEVISVPALLKADQQANYSEEREHVTPYLRRHPELFRLHTLPILDKDESASSLRLTVDYPSDYALLQLLYTTLGPDFSLKDALDLMAKFPWLAQLNADNTQIQV